jgi:ABC-type branched-subunit amino acid transport system substrate-binding protein
MKEMFCWVAQIAGPTEGSSLQVQIATDTQDWSEAVEKLRKIVTGRVLAGPMPQGKVWV